MTQRLVEFKMVTVGVNSKCCVCGKKLAPGDEAFMAVEKHPSLDRRCAACFAAIETFPLDTDPC